MTIDTIQLSETRDTTIRLSGNTQISLDGRPLRRSATRGRFFVADKDLIKVRLEQGGQLRDQELTLTPPVAIIINDGRTYEGVTKLQFVKESMQICSNEDQKKKNTIRQLTEQLRTLDAQEQQLRRELQERQAAVQRLEQNKQDEERQITQLTNEVTSLQQQKTQQEQTKAAEEQLLTQLNDAIISLQQQNAQLVQTNGSLVKLQGDLTQVNAALTQAQNQAVTLNQDLTKAKNDRDQAVQNNEVTAAAIQYLQEQITKEKLRHDALKQQENDLNAELSNYSPEVIVALEDSIRKLEDLHTAAKSEWTRLSGEKRVWELQLDEQRTANEQITQQIAQQPEELRNLQEAYENLSRRLTETINAQEMCSEEKQKELQEQIDEQEPIAQQLTEQYRALEKHADELTQTIAELQKAKDEEMLRLYPKLTQGLAEIMQRVGDMNAEMESLRAEAEQFNQHVNACAERMESLKEWYHVDKTPLQKLVERLGEMTSSENEQLLRTMNPAKVDRVRLLFENVEAGLAELDAILKDVIKAAQKDEKFTNLRVTTNDEFARREMKKQQ